MAFLAGMAAGFALAVLAGHWAGRHGKPDHFKRIHQLISPESLYYPPFDMLENLALAKWSPGKTLVLVGGSSIMRGNGQPEADLWSTRLQKELGDRYVVVNLAFVGSAPGEGAGLVAESLIRKGVPLIYVADSGPTIYYRAFGGIYSYLYWDALYKHRLLPFQERDAAVAEWEKTLPPKERIKEQEMRLSERLDAPLRFQSLWHYVAYRGFFTVWNYLVPGDGNWWKPRHRFPDCEPKPPPVEQRFKLYFDSAMNTVRGVTQNRAELDIHGNWSMRKEAVEAVQREISRVFHPALRPHLIMLLPKNCPYYLERLTPDERRSDDFVYGVYQKIFEDNGIVCAIVGQDFATGDYVDRCHLAPNGGRKLSDIVAGQIRKLKAR